jgi:peptidoglycan/LPS O-acetylase OafA/YrhL
LFVLLLKILINWYIKLINNQKSSISGIQSISIISIIFYHAKVTIFGFQFFNGGFIGIDVFFLISGYLTTSIILGELLNTKNFSFEKFYKTKIIEIFPVLLVVILITFILAWFYLLPNDFMEYSKSSITTLSFTSNYYFYFSDYKFEEVKSLLNPLFHTWAISILIQFYILFPIILFILFKYLRKYLIHFLILSFLISLGSADWISRKYDSSSFYFINTRIWEFLVGSILAYIQLENKQINENQKLNFLMSNFGIILLVYSIIFFNNEMYYPSYSTLIPIFGVSLIILFSHKKNIVTNILSSKLFVGISLISFSLYLWHYPIFSFSRIISFTDNSLIKEALVGLTIILLSVFTYFITEKNYKNRINHFNNVIKLLSVLFIAAIILSLSTISNNGFKKRNHFPKVIINTYENLNYRKITQDNLDCHNRLGDKGFCIFNQMKNNIGDIVILGDSLTDALLKNLVLEISKTKYRLIHMSYSGNLYLPGYVVYDKYKKKIINDESQHVLRKKFIKENTHKNTYIVVYGDYNNQFFEKRLNIDENQKIYTKFSPSYNVNRNNINLSYKERINLIKNKFKRTLLNLSKDNKVILIYPSPTSTESVLIRIKNNSKKIKTDKDFYLKDYINYPVEIYKKFNTDVINFFENIDAENIYKIKLEKNILPTKTMYIL